MGKLIIAGVVLGFVAAVPSQAATLAFTGNFGNSNLPASAGGRCAGLTVTISNGPAPLFAAGTTNLGDFTATQSHCLNGPPPIAAGAPSVGYFDGLFTFSFAGGASLSGTYYGSLSNSGVTGIVDNVQHFAVTGGTGVYAGATGSFLGTGDIRFIGGPPVARLTFSEGRIDAPSVPEPASWGLMLGGFGAIGAAMRHRRQVAVIA